MSAAVFHNGGYTWTEWEQYDNAVADFTEAIRLDRTDAYAYVGRSAAYDACDEHVRGMQPLAKMIADCTEAIRIDPSYFDAYNWRGRAS